VLCCFEMVKSGTEARHKSTLPGLLARATGGQGFGETFSRVSGSTPMLVSVALVRLHPASPKGGTVHDWVGSTTDRTPTFSHFPVALTMTGGKEQAQGIMVGLGNALALANERVRTRSRISTCSLCHLGGVMGGGGWVSAGNHVGRAASAGVD
jgi:hypothetical protein